jgi:hypothetical protein
MVVWGVKKNIGKVGLKGKLPRRYIAGAGLAQQQQQPRYLNAGQRNKAMTS